MQPTQSYEFEAIGTVWTIDVYQQISSEASTGLLKTIKSRIDMFDKAYSRFRDDSLVTQMATHKGMYVLPDDAQPMLELYKQLYDITDGSMTPLIGSIMEEAGYDAKYSLQPGTLHKPIQWDDAISYGAPKLLIKQPALLDFGAAGKGYLADIVAGVLLENGVNDFCINAGGDIVHHAAVVARIGLEHPDQPGMAIGVAELDNQALCGSAGNRRNWAQYHHIIDPKRLESPRHIKAVWVAAKTGLLSDALTTALYFVEPQKLAGYFEFEYAIMTADNGLRRSASFPATFFTKEGRS